MWNTVDLHKDQNRESKRAKQDPSPLRPVSLAVVPAASYSGFPDLLGNILESQRQLRCKAVNEDPVVPKKQSTPSSNKIECKPSQRTSDSLLQPLPKEPSPTTKPSHERASRTRPDKLPDRSRKAVLGETSLPPQPHLGTVFIPPKCRRFYRPNLFNLQGHPRNAVSIRFYSLQIIDTLRPVPVRI